MKMSKEEFDISPVIITAVDLMKKVNEGLEVEFLSGMKRNEPSEFYPIGQSGVSTKMTFFGIEKQVFLGYQLCEDMLNPIGHLVAEDYIMGIFKDDIFKKFKDFDFTYGPDDNKE
jgi:hypothetical protein